jgi:hypothetical protein
MRKQQNGIHLLEGRVQHRHGAPQLRRVLAAGSDDLQRQKNMSASMLLGLQGQSAAGNITARLTALDTSTVASYLGPDGCADLSANWLDG